MADRVGYGVVGAGSIGIRAALTHLSQEDVQSRTYLAAVCDPVPGRAEAAKEKFGVVSAYVGYEDLLADPNVDAVTLCSPIGLHYEQAMLAIEAGKHIHFNKTMTTEEWEATEVINAAQAKGVKLVASPGMMLHPYNQRLRKGILDGELGKLAWAATGAAGVQGYHINEPIRQGNDVLSNINPAWYFRKPGGGPQYDVTVYCLHNLTGLGGPAKRVTAMSGLVEPFREFRGEQLKCDMDDNTLLLIDFGNAFFAFAYGSVSGRVTQGFFPSIFGTTGKIEGSKLNDVDMRHEGDHQPHVVGVHPTLGENHVFCDMMQLVDWILDDKPTIANAEHARHVIEIIDAGFRAAETGVAQDLKTTFTPLTLDELQGID